MHHRQFNLLINAGAILLAVVVIGYIAYDATHTASTSPCSARYGAAMRLALHGSDGKPLSPMALQARAGDGRSVGVLENASVVSVDRGPLPDAIEVNLRNVPESSDNSGIQFRWSPFGGQMGSAVCLSYYLHLPSAFAFGPGGELLGVGGASPSSPEASALSIQMQWDDKGEPLVRALTADRDTIRFDGSTPLPTGRWLRIEQETVLNTAGKSDGILRLWVDRALAVENSQLSLSSDVALQFNRVLVAAGYSQPQSDAATLQITGIEISRPK